MSGVSETAVARVEREWNRLYLAHDVDGFADLLDDDFVYVSERGRFTKNDYVSNLAAGVIEMIALETRASTTRLFDQVAIVDGQVVMKARFKGQDISGTDSYTRIWRVSGGKLRALSQHANAKSTQ